MIVCKITRECDYCGDSYEFSSYADMARDENVRSASISVNTNRLLQGRTFSADLCEVCTAKLEDELQLLFKKYQMNKEAK